MFWPSDRATSNATPSRFFFGWVHLALCTAEALDFNDFRPTKSILWSVQFPLLQMVGKGCFFSPSRTGWREKTSRGSDKSGLFYTSCSFWWSRDVVFLAFCYLPLVSKKKILLFLKCVTHCATFACRVVRWKIGNLMFMLWVTWLYPSKKTQSIEWWMVVFALNRNFSFGNPYELGFKWL